MNYKEKIERAEYRSREILIRIQGVNNWIKDNPNITDANMYEIMNYLIETGWILSGLNNNDIPDTAKEVVNEMKYMLSARKDYIEDFITSLNIKAIWNNYVNNVFSGKLEFNSTEEDKKKKELLCKEMGVANYIYGVKRNEPNYKYDNKSEFEDMIALNNSIENQDIMSQVLLKIIEKNFDKERTKGHLNSNIQNKCYDQITFSSPEEEAEFINNSTNNFSLEEFFQNHIGNNALIILDNNNEYCLEPVDFHMPAAMKLYRTIHNVSTDKSIEEALDFDNDQGNVVMHLINRGGLKAIIPFFPTEINEFQLSKLELYLNSLEDVYSKLNDNEKDIFNDCLEQIRKYINKYQNENHKTGITI